MDETWVIALPPVARAGEPDTRWWRTAGGAIIDHGSDGSWTTALASADGAALARVVGLAPVASVRVSSAERRGSTVRQAEAVARVAEVDSSLGDAATLHAVTAIDPATSRVIIAVVANATMLEWIEWLAAFGCDPQAIVPAALLFPFDENWTSAEIAGEHVVGRGGLVFPNEPGLASALIGQDEVEEVAPERIDEALLDTVLAPPLNLRSGRFARRRRMAIDRDRVRELTLLLMFIPLISLVIAIANIVSLNRDSDRIDAEAARIAARVLARPTTVDLAQGELDALAARTPGAGEALSAPLSALYQQMQPESATSLTNLGWRGDGTLSVTLAAPRADDINRVLIALQRDGYRVTAVPRQGSDGRTLADITVRVTP